MNELQNLFELTKVLSITDVKTYMEAHSVDFKGKLGFCPFHAHDHKSPSLGLQNKKGEPFFNCFACGSAGDVVKFSQLYYKSTPLEAAKKVLDFFKIPYIDTKVEMSDEQREKLEADIEARKAEAKARRDKAISQEARLKAFMVQRATEQAPKFAENYAQLFEHCKEEVFKNFPNRSALFTDWANTYLGFDAEHQSIVIINRDDKEVTNIKHRQKFIYDDKAKALTTKRVDGKWIGMKYLNGAPFPLSYFKQHQDNRVIICEGEKDALNLLSYGVNVLTLGGVSNSWEEHKSLLKNKIVYIWFDNDIAGYENALKRYYEIEKIAQDIFFIPFFSLNAALPNKYDISDFLSDNDHKIKNAEDIFNLIAYSCFKLTNSLIDELEEFTGTLFKEYRRISKIKDFRDIKREFMKKNEDGHAINVFIAKGELDDEEVEHVINKMGKLKKTEVYDQVKQVVTQVLFGKDEKIEKAEDVMSAIDKTLDIKRALLNNYRQTHIVDIVQSFIRMANKVDYTFGEYKGNLHVWTGTHYLQIDHNDLAKFIHNQWMFESRVDFKKQTKQNVDQVVENLISKSRNLDEDKQYEERRVINVLNGTLFISKNGKVTFVNEHRKKDAATNILHFEYNQKASAPKWKRFLNRVLPDIDDQSSLMEFIGYCFMPSHKFETFLFLYGKSGANGKSVILDTIKRFFGDDNVSGLQLQQLEGHQLQALTNKILNIGSEIDKTGTDKGQLATLKQLVSPEDPVQINPKNDKPYVLRPNEKPKLAFAGNDKPRNGLDDAVFRRMLLLSFGAEIKDDEKIRGLSDRFNDEMAGIFNMALEGMERLIKNGKFTRSTRMKEELEEYKDEVNPLRTFIRDALITDKKIMVPSQYIYALYRAYVFNAGGKPKNDSNFWKGIKEELSSDGIKTELKQVRLKYTMLGLHERTRCAIGIGVNKDFEVNTIAMDGNIIVKTEEMNISADNSLPMEDIND